MGFANEIEHCAILFTYARKNFDIFDSYEKNFKISGENVYIDDIHIFNIVVRYSSENVSYEEAVGYLSRFGEVRSLTLFNHYEGRWAAVVKFVEARDVANLLAMEKMLSNKLQIYPTALWLHSACCSSETTSILHLNDDCLFEVFQYFDDLDDMMRLASVCDRFQYIIADCIKTQNVTLNQFTANELDSANNITLLMTMSPYIRRLELIGLSDDLYAAALQEQLPRMRNLIEFSCIGSEAGLSDYYVLECSQLPKLSKLTITSDDFLQGYYLEKLINIKELNLFACSCLNTEYFIAMCKAAKNLTDLTINLKIDMIEAMVADCKNLTRLEFAAKVPYVGLALLNSLTHVKVIAANNGINYFLYALAQHKAKQLESLEIEYKFVMPNMQHMQQISKISALKSLFIDVPGPYAMVDEDIIDLQQLQNLEQLAIDSSKVTNTGVLNLLQKCTKLNRISLNYCGNISNELIFSCIELMTQRSMNNHVEIKPLILFVSATNCTEDIYEMELYVKNTALVQVILD